MQGFKCKVTNAGHKQLTTAKPPVWCADDERMCRKGAKQMIVFNREYAGSEFRRMLSTDSVQKRRVTM